MCSWDDKQTQIEISNKREREIEEKGMEKAREKAREKEREMREGEGERVEEEKRRETHNPIQYNSIQ